MTTLAVPILITCPDWCRLPAEHGWDSYDPTTGLQWRGHAGPAFGYAYVGGDETSNLPGHVTLDAGLDSSIPENPTAGDLRELAADCLRAAEWLEAHQ